MGGSQTGSWYFCTQRHQSRTRKRSNDHRSLAGKRNHAAGQGLEFRRGLPPGARQNGSSIEGQQKAIAYRKTFFKSRRTSRETLALFTPQSSRTCRSASKRRCSDGDDVHNMGKENWHPHKGRELYNSRRKK